MLMATISTIYVEYNDIRITILIFLIQLAFRADGNWKLNFKCGFLVFKFPFLKWAFRCFICANKENGNNLLMFWDTFVYKNKFYRYMYIHICKIKFTKIFDRYELNLFRRCCSLLLGFAM